MSSVRSVYDKDKNYDNKKNTQTQRWTKPWRQGLLIMQNEMSVQSRDKGKRNEVQREKETAKLTTIYMTTSPPCSSMSERTHTQAKAVEELSGDNNC